MARRRLSPLPHPLEAEVEAAVLRSGRAARHDSAAPTDIPRAEGGAREARAPIATVAGDAARVSAYEEMAETLRAARTEGRILLDLALDAVAPDHLVRDRVAAEDPRPDAVKAPKPHNDDEAEPGASNGDEFAALKASIRAHGQRTPIEVTPIEGPLPYGLISGWRRLVALRALHAETGETRFATVRALVTKPESAGNAYVAMVEENELRVGLSYYERARVAALATRRGVFANEAEAIRTLFATASAPKRSRIKAFIEIVNALDDALRFPAALPERLGLKLVERLRAGKGEGDRIAAALAEAAPKSAKDEAALLTRLVAPPRRPAQAATAAKQILVAPGITLEAHRRGKRLTLALTGSGVTPDLEGRLAAELPALLQRLAHSS